MLLALFVIVPSYKLLISTSIIIINTWDEFLSLICPTCQSTVFQALQSFFHSWHVPLLYTLNASPAVLKSCSESLRGCIAVSSTMASGSAAAAHFLKAPFILCNCTYPIQTDKYQFLPPYLSCGKKHKKQKTRNKTKQKPWKCNKFLALRSVH